MQLLHTAILSLVGEVGLLPDFLFFLCTCSTEYEWGLFFFNPGLPRLEPPLPLLLPLLTTSEELAQQTFVTAWKRLAELRERLSSVPGNREFTGPLGHRIAHMLTGQRAALGARCASARC